jgi:flavin-dependent dehydrogenase
LLIAARGEVLQPEQRDVVVDGAGLAGLVCAGQLAERGLRVLLLDRKSSLREAIPTTGIFVRRTLVDFDLPSECLGPPIRHVTLYSPARRSLHLESTRPEFQIGRMGTLYQRYLEQCQSAGVEWAPGTKYAGCEPCKAGSILYAARKGRLLRFQARFVVGADGARSSVARDLGLDLNREWIVGAEEVLRGVPLEGPPRLHCFLDPAVAPGYLAWFANDGEEAHLGVAGYPAEFYPAAALESFRRSLRDVFGLRGAVTAEKRGGLIPVGGVLQRIANHRGLLVGDAAGAPSPLTAGGLDPCFRLSHLAARVASDFVRSNNPEALHTYSGARFRARFNSRLWMRRVLASIRSEWLMEAGFLLLRLALARPIAWHVFFGRGSFPDSPGQVAFEPASGSRPIRS